MSQGLLLASTAVIPASSPALNPFDGWEPVPSLLTEALSSWFLTLFRLNIRPCLPIFFNRVRPAGAMMDTIVSNKAFLVNELRRIIPMSSIYVLEAVKTTDILTSFFDTGWDIYKLMGGMNPAF
jgi:hypothetical protein